MGTLGTSAARVDRPARAVDGAIVDGFDAEPLATTAHLAGAVVIPAHDEAAVIARTLAHLAPLADAGVEIIVACNGCTDETADIARRFAGVTVVETSEASKVAGLNLGDRTATSWPRLYLDADIDVEPAAVAAAFAALAEPTVLAARPCFGYDISGASLPVRAYYRARARIAAPTRRMWGAGGYATNEVGHARFAAFPMLTADDYWFDALFADDEKRVVATAPMRVRTPRDTRTLLGVLMRQHRGHVQQSGEDAGATGAGRVASLLRAVRGIRDAVDAGWYVGLTVAARVRLALRDTASQTWERDLSSRGAQGVTA